MKNNDKINLLNDAMFKSLVRSSEARNIVLKVIHDITHVAMEELEQANFIGGEIPKMNIHEKGKISDVIISANTNSLILEMNQWYTSEILDKNLQYAFAWNVQSSHLTKIILINFDEFNTPFHTDKPLLEFKMRDEGRHVESDLITSYHLILANYNNPLYNVSEETRTFMEFLHSKKTITELEEKYKGNEAYLKMIKKIKKLTQDEKFMGYYDLEEKHQWQLNDSYKTGVKQGIEQGVHQNKIEMAKMMLGKYSQEEIIRLTGLTKKEITNLK